LAEKKEWVEEGPYEVKGDTIFGLSQGALLGRKRREEKKPKLFEGMEFFCYGKLERPPKEELVRLIEGGGGTLLSRKPSLPNVGERKGKQKAKLKDLEHLPDPPMVVYDPLHCDPAAPSHPYLALFPLVRETSWILNAISSHSLP